MLDIRRLSTQDADFSAQFSNVLQQNQSAENDVRDTVEMIMEFEKEFEITIPDEDAEKIATVGDALTYLGEKVG